MRNRHNSPVRRRTQAREPGWTKKLLEMRRIVVIVGTQGVNEKIFEIRGQLEGGHRCGGTSGESTEKIQAIPASVQPSDGQVLGMSKGGQDDTFSTR